ncbi:MAG: DUF92 domain-containing protein [Salinibacter sp.]
MCPSTADGLLLLASILGLRGLVAGGEVLHRWGVSPAWTRRLVHVGVCLTVAATPLLFSGPGPVYLLAGVFVVLNGTAYALDSWPSLHAARPTSWGTVALPLAVLPAVAATWSVSPDRVVAVQAAFLVLGVADPVASWVGNEFGGRWLTATATVRGTVAFGGAAGLVVALVLVAVGEPPAAALFVAGITGGVAAVVEALSRWGWDNLFVVLGVLGVLVPLRAGTVSPLDLGGALAAGIGFWGLTYRAGVLDGPGAAGGGLLAASLVGVGGVGWVGPALAFFVPSAALSRLPSPSGATADPSRRTLRQVLANGAVAWGCLLAAALLPPGALAERAACYAGFGGALAAAAADTWATEIGIRYAGRPYSLRHLGRVARGTSGAVTFGGTVAALGGAATVAAGAGATIPPAFGAPSSVWAIGGAGLAGMGLDSLAGATIQARYRAAGRGEPPEYPSTPGERPVQGWAAVDNDAVNLLGTLGGAAVSACFWAL